MSEQRIAAEQQRALATKCLAHRHQQQRDFVGAQVGHRNAAAAKRPDHTSAVRVIHIQRCILAARDHGQLAQRRQVAIHAEHAIGGEQGGALGRGHQLAQRGFRIAVRIALEFAAGQSRAVDQAGVVALVLHADVAIAEQGLQDGKVGQVAAAEQQGARIAHPLGGFALERGVFAVVPANQCRGAAADAVMRAGFLERTHHIQVLGQAEVIVAAKIHQGAAADAHVHAIARLDCAARTQQCLRRTIGAGCEHAINQPDSCHGLFRRRRNVGHPQMHRPALRRHPQHRPAMRRPAAHQHARCVRQRQASRRASPPGPGG